MAKPRLRTSAPKGSAARLSLSLGDFCYRFFVRYFFGRYVFNARLFLRWFFRCHERRHGFSRPTELRDDVGQRSRACHRGDFS